ncbi:MAG: hypothetical protein SH818_03095 [Saprospiraceae bacterium]|nr:hypothetical protein [Saprospiraceae bacterium]
MDNSKEYIKQLLDKYWNSESSLEEEKALAAYFNQPEIDQEFEVYRPLFNYFDEQRQLTIDLEDQIMSRISDKKEKGKIIQMPWRRVVSIAASIALFLSVLLATFQYRNQNNREMDMVDTFQTPEEALEQTKAALLFLSHRMNKASDQAAKSLSKTQSLNILN